MNKNSQQTTKAAPNSADNWFEYIKEDFLPQHGTKVTVVIVIIAVAIFAIAQHFSSAGKKQSEMAEELGKGLNYIYIGKNDSALITLENSIQAGTLSGLPLAKATLLAGNIHMQNGNTDSAAALFKKTLSNASGVDIISSAAEHGLATVAMEKQNYSEAITLLNAFVKKWGKRTGDMKERATKTEPQDIVPTVPDALWKLTLCYLETGDKETAKQTAQKILKIYGDTPKAADASKLLATL